MPLDPRCESFLAMVDAAPVPDFDELTPEILRGLYRGVGRGCVIRG